MPKQSRKKTNTTEAKSDSQQQEEKAKPEKSSDTEKTSKEIPEKPKNVGSSSKKSSSQKSKEEPSALLSDPRFAALKKKKKLPPVDLYGNPTSPDSLINYVSSSDEDDTLEIPPELQAEPEPEVIQADHYTTRLALTNLPWKKASASDIYQTIYNALDQEGHGSDLQEVAVYLSHYGEQHPIENEEVKSYDDPNLQLRAWQMQHEKDMKRYFAILSFSSSETAELVQKALQGFEYQTSGSTFNFSIVTEEDFNNEISKMTVRDRCNSIDENWQPPNLDSAALTQTKLRDEDESDDEERRRIINAIWEERGSEDEVGSDDEIAADALFGSGSEDDDRPTREQLGDLLAAMNNQEEESENEEEEKNQKSGKEIVIEFTSKSIQKSNKKEEFPIDEESEDEEGKKKQKQKTKKGKAEKQKKQTKRTKSIKEEEEEKEERNPEEIVDEIKNDTRFSDLFEKSGYSIDTQAPNFQKTKEMQLLMAEVSKKHQAERKDKINEPKPTTSSIADKIIERSRKNNKK